MDVKEAAVECLPEVAPQAREEGVPPGYKRTETGVIPEDWEVLPLHAVLEHARLGGNYPNQNYHANYPLMKMGNIARGKFNFERIEYITLRTQPDASHQLKFGDVVFNTRNTLDLVGKVAMWRNELPLAYFNSNLLRLEFDVEKISSNAYANYTLNTTSSIRYLRSMATGTTSVAAIYTRDLMNFPFIVPPRAEQRAIATALSDADALIDALQRLIAKKRAIKQGTMQALLTGRQRLPGFTGEWKGTQLGELGVCYRGVGYQPGTDLLSGDVAESVRLLRANNVQGSRVDLHGLQFVRSPCVNGMQFLKNGDVLVCLANGSKELVGKSAPFNVSDGFTYTFGAFMGCFRINAERVNPGFCTYLFQSGAYRQQLSVILAGSSISNLSPPQIESLDFDIPVARQEQAAIATVLADMDTEIEALEARLAKTRALKAGMMQQLLTGRIRLPLEEAA